MNQPPIPPDQLPKTPAEVRGNTLIPGDCPVCGIAMEDLPVRVPILGLVPLVHRACATPQEREMMR